MQTWSGQSTKETRPQTPRVVMYTILCFALAGLIAGFAIGGFSHKPATNNTANNPGPVKTATSTITAMRTVVSSPTAQTAVELNPPNIIPLPSATEKADGATQYSIGAQTIDKGKQSVHAPDITCKAWLVQQIPDNKVLSIDSTDLKNVANLTGPIAGKVDDHPFNEVSGLSFDGTTPQTHLCDSKGQMIWKYTITPSIPVGTYDIVILTDWQGLHWNWSWAQFAVVV